MCHTDNAWCCDESGDWYSDDDSDERVEVDGCTYHKDNAPETDDETTEVSTETSTETTGE
jgi:hypothetical protein